MKRILCFGDSNTYGYDAFSDGRFGEETRWTGLIQRRYQGQAVICEAGQNGRTCGFEDPKDPARNGRAVLEDTLSHFWPLDGAVVMLGTNDAKVGFGATAEVVAGQMEQLLVEMQRYAAGRGRVLPVLLLAPVPLTAESRFYVDFTPESVVLTRALGGQYQRLAQRLGVAFADAGTWGIALDFDGTHYTPAGHRRFASRVAPELERVFELTAPKQGIKVPSEFV